MPELNFLYLIASGNNDSIYKVGISTDPAARLRQIKATYNVPRAHIVETMDVQSRAEVFALETAIHARFESRRTTRYGGREFFKFNQSDLEWLRNLYRENSNDFAQAKAYYGLKIAADELKDRAQALEQERQKKISYNRKHGKKYDTKPSGALKRYNGLKDKMRKSHLGQRFDIEKRSHPCVSLSNQIQSQIIEIVNRKNGFSFLKVSVVGAFSGIMVGSVNGMEAIAGFTMTGSMIGLLSGSLSQAMRSNEEREKAKRVVESEIEARYPRMLSSAQIVLADHQASKFFLVKDYEEDAEDLRNRNPRVPSVSLPSADKIYSVFEGKSYFPKVASVITVALTISLGVIGGAPRSRSSLPSSSWSASICASGVTNLALSIEGANHCRSRS